MTPGPRRGQAEILDWLPRLILLLVAVVTIALFVRWNVDRDVEAAATHRATYLARLWYDPTLLTYADPVTKRAYPGVLDKAKLAPDALDARYGVTGSIGSRLTITAPPCMPTTTLYHDKALVEEFSALAEARVSGAGSATAERIGIPITVVDGSSRCPGTLEILVVRPNTPRSSGTVTGAGGTFGGGGASASFGGGK